MNGQAMHWKSAGSKALVRLLRNVSRKSEIVEGSRITMNVEEFDSQ